MARTQGAGLKRSLGLAGLSFYGTGLILGAGIYSILGTAAGETGDAVWMSFLLGSVAALLTGLSYAELGAMLPKAGAEYAYAGEAWPRARWLRSVLGFTIAAAGTATAATVAAAFAGYFQLFLGVPALLVAAALLAIVTALNVSGVQHASRVNTVFTLAEAAGLIALVIAGSRDPDFGDALAATPNAGVLAGAGLVFFAYLGFEDIANLAEETKDPAKNIPRAILIAVTFSTLLYVLVALASVALIGSEQLARSDSPLADAMHEASPMLADVLGAVALFATANTALIALLAASRVLYGMARGKDAPRALGKVLPGRDTPWVASLTVMSGAFLLLPLGGVAFIGSVASLAALLAFVVVNACCIRLRLDQPRAERPFRVPLSLGRVPLLPVAGMALALALVTQFDAVVYLIVAGVLLAAFGIYAVRTRVTD